MSPVLTVAQSAIPLVTVRNRAKSRTAVRCDFDRVVAGRPGPGSLGSLPAGQFVLGEGDRGGPQGGGDGVQAALPAGGGLVLGVVGRQGEPVAGEEVLQRAGQRAAPGRGSLQQGLRVDGSAVAQEPPGICDHLAGGGGVVAGHEVVREAGQPGGRVVEPGGEVLSPDRDPVRGPGIAGKAEPVAFQMGDQAASPAGSVGAGRPAGVGAVPAPAGGLADPARLAAPRAGLLSCGPPVLDQAQAADLAADPPDLPARSGRRSASTGRICRSSRPASWPCRSRGTGSGPGDGPGRSGSGRNARGPRCRPACRSGRTRGSYVTGCSPHIGGIDRPRAARGLGGGELGRSGCCGPFHGGGVDVEQVVRGALQGGAQREREW